MPAAARATDAHQCPKSEPGPVPHVGGPIQAGESSVLIGHQPAAREGDMAACCGPPDTIQTGESTVLIGNKPAARLGDPMAHGGVITAGCPTVLIGAEITELDAPFCEVCDKARREQEKRDKEQERGQEQQA